MQSQGSEASRAGRVHADAAALSPCPFCGGEAALRRHPEIHEVVRVECVGPECEIHPRTEYLLEEYAGELAAAWNRRWTPRVAGAAIGGGRAESTSAADGARPFRRPAGRAVS